MSEPAPQKEVVSGLKLITERDMSTEWRGVRDEIRDTISGAVGRVETAKFAGKQVLDGFGVNAELIGTRPGMPILVTIEEPADEGVYLGVREASTQEASKVVVNEDGSRTVFYARMPNFEPGHSPEIGGYVATGGTVYEIGERRYAADGTITNPFVSVDAQGMVRDATGELNYQPMKTDEMQAAQVWASDVAAELTGSLS